MGNQSLTNLTLIEKEVAEEKQKTKNGATAVVGEEIRLVWGENKER